MGEDAARFRVRHAPANNATLNNIVLAVVFHRGFRYLPEANRHYMMRREDALEAILSPDRVLSRHSRAGADTVPRSCARSRGNPAHSPPGTPPEPLSCAESPDAPPNNAAPVTCHPSPSQPPRACNHPVMALSPG